MQIFILVLANPFIFVIFAGDIEKNEKHLQVMKSNMRHKIVLVKAIFVFSIIFLSMTVVESTAQTVVHISNTGEWKTSEMSKYVGQTVQFDVPFYICNNYYNHSGQYQISPRRLFSPTNQALPSSVEYNTIVSLNDAGEVTLNGVSDYHRMGEMISNLTVKVSSARSWQYVSGKYVGNKRTDLSKGYESVDKKGEHTLLVCAFNLEYYLVENLGSGSQGPTTKALQTRQHTKIMEALGKIRADVFGFEFDKETLLMDRRRHECKRHIHKVGICVLYRDCRADWQYAQQ